MAQKQEMGRAGERAAELYYQGKGFSTVEKNFRTRRGELDLVCARGGLLLFVEVKSRQGDWEDQAWEPRWRRKGLRIRGLHRSFLAQRPEFRDWEFRWEIVYVTQGRVTAVFPGL